MCNYVLGFDGGGTKTTVQAMDINGNKLFRIVGESLNPNGTSPENISKRVAELLENAKVQAGADKELVAVCLGVAGISNPITLKLIKEGLSLANFSRKEYITSDFETACVGALSNKDGILLISGTGAVCMARCGGENVRVGGYGHLIDDEGSGYALGRDVLRAVIEAHDGRGEKTYLSEAVFDYLRITTIQELISYVYTPNRPKKDIADLAILLTKADADDGIVDNIYNRAAKSLVLLVETAAKRLSLTNCEVALSGSVIQNNDYILEKFKKMLAENYPYITPIIPHNDAAIGACMLACSL